MGIKKILLIPFIIVGCSLFLIFRPVNGEIKYYNDYTSMPANINCSSKRLSSEELQQSVKEQTEEVKPKNSETKTSSDIDKVIEFCKSKEGLPYVWGGTGPNGYDCSGLMQAAYRSVGVEIGRSTYNQILTGQVINSLAEAKPGDLLFPHAGHVVMYLGNNMVVHAPQTGDVIKEKTISSNYAKYGIRRVIPNQ